MVVTGAGVNEDDVERVRGIVMDEVNVKDIEYISTSSGIVTQTAKPNFKRLGSRLGNLMKAVNQAVRELSEQEIKEYMREGTIELQVNGHAVALGPDDLEIASEGIEGWLVDQEDSVTVALDVTVTDELRTEGFAREIVNRVQNMRKSANFEVTDRIFIQYRATGGLVGALEEFGTWIRNETLALELEEADQPAGEFVESFDVGDERIKVAVRRSNSSDSH
jgi:isoleucyl-tRNA synthetase